MLSKQYRKLYFSILLNITLIDNMQNFPCLYAVHSKSKEDLNMKNNAWKEEADQIEKPSNYI